MYTKYVIQEGDSVSSLVHQFHTSAEDLLSINDLYDFSSLRVGSEIVVPNQKEYYDVYTIEKGDSLYGISKQYNINPSLLAAMNGLNLNDYIYPNQQLLIPKSGYRYYITKEGDTLEMVADQFGISEEEVAQQNVVYLLDGQLLVSKIK